jgi:predicted secreted Zn-dependent protease
LRIVGSQLSLVCGRYVGAMLRLGIACVLSVVAWLGPAVAGVSFSIDNRTFYVSGTTPTSLVRYMNSHAIQGDHGNAYASIHPNYRLGLSTKQAGGICRADVDIDLHFTLTLPKANTSGMSRSTRSAWNSFVSFARAHEEHHRLSYIACAKAFVAKAERMTDKQCFSLNADIRKMFAQMKRDCESKQRPFDAAQARVLAGSSLFAMARRGRH